MKLLINAIHYPVCSARYMVDAYRRLGHEVYHVGQETGRAIWNMQVPEKYVWNADPPPEDWEPHLAILMDTAYQWHDPYAMTVVHTVDNHVRDVRQPGIAHYFLAHKLVSLTAYGDDCTWLPCGYDDHWFGPSPIPWAERAYDVCMIGVMYPQRWELVNAMRAAGLKVMAGTGLVYDAYRDAYQNSRVALVSSACGDLPIRLFEGAGMGCVVLHDPMKDLDDLQPPRSPFFQAYQSVEMAVQLALETSGNADDRAVERNSFWAQQHTWEARAKVIIQWWQEAQT